MKTAYIGLGGNQGAVRNHFLYALQRLKEEGCCIQSVSSLYRTPAWGKTNQPDFLNACVKLATDLPPQRLLNLALRIESERGRLRTEKWGARSLDIDILMFSNIACSAKKDGDLILPHPFIVKRAFVLLPLAEIAPDAVLDGKTIAQWADSIRKSGEADGIRKIASPAQWGFYIYS